MNRDAWTRIETAVVDGVLVTPTDTEVLFLGPDGAVACLLLTAEDIAEIDAQAKIFRAAFKDFE